MNRKTRNFNNSINILLYFSRWLSISFHRDIIKTKRNFIDKIWRHFIIMYYLINLYYMVYVMRNCQVGENSSTMRYLSTVFELYFGFSSIMSIFFTSFMVENKFKFFINNLNKITANLKSDGEKKYRIFLRKFSSILLIWGLLESTYELILYNIIHFRSDHIFFTFSKMTHYTIVDIQIYLCVQTFIVYINILQHHFEAVTYMMSNFSNMIKSYKNLRKYDNMSILNQLNSLLEKHLTLCDLQENLCEVFGPISAIYMIVFFVITTWKSYYFISFITFTTYDLSALYAVNTALYMLYGQFLMICLINESTKITEQVSA